MVVLEEGTLLGENPLDRFSGDVWQFMVRRLLAFGGGPGQVDVVQLTEARLADSDNDPDEKFAAFARSFKKNNVPLYSREKD